MIAALYPGSLLMDELAPDVLRTLTEDGVVSTCLPLALLFTLGCSLTTIIPACCFTPPVATCAILLAGGWGRDWS